MQSAYTPCSEWIYPPAQVEIVGEGDLVNEVCGHSLAWASGTMRPPCMKHRMLTHLAKCTPSSSPCRPLSAVACVGTSLRPLRFNQRQRAANPNHACRAPCLRCRHMCALPIYQLMILVAGSCVVEAPRPGGPGPVAGEMG